MMRKITMLLMLVAIVGFASAQKKQARSQRANGMVNVQDFCKTPVAKYIAAPVQNVKPVEKGTKAVILTEGFEGTTFPPAGWVLKDADNDTINWISYSATNSAHTGTLSAASASWTSADGPLTPDNYLITPQINVTSANFVLKFWVAAQDPSWAAEKYSVMISTTDTAATSFTAVYTETLTNATWKEITIPLNTYNGQSIYIAFRHFDCTNMFMMKLDDILIDELEIAPNCATTPSPANAATNAWTTSKLTWVATGATEYDVYFGTTTNPALVATVSIPTYTPTLAANTQYFWKVVPKNSIGSATGCEEWSFTTGNTVYTMTNAAVSVCDGFFADDGGPEYVYSPSINVVKTFTPSVAGNRLKMIFSDWEMDTNDDLDTLFIYDGLTTSANLIGVYTNAATPGTIEATNADGALTFKFTSNEFTSGEGWVATISCFTPAAFDAAILDITSPNNNASCSLTATEAVTVTVKNLGGSTITSLPISYQINGGTAVTETISTPITTGATLNYTFTQTANLSAAGDYTVHVTTALPSDANTANDFIDAAVTSATGTISLILTTDNYPEELSFAVINTANGDTAYSVNSFSNSNTDYSYTVCVDNANCYSVVLYDSYGDGGFTYTASYNGTQVNSGTWTDTLASTPVQLTIAQIGTNCAPLTIEETNTNVVSIYPNPANDVLNITNAENATITIYNVLGSVVKTAVNTNQISLTDVAEGSYIVKVVKANNVITKKINVVK